MQRTDNNQTVKSNHRKVQSSTTLSRKYTKRPVAATSTATPIQRSPKIQHFGNLIDEDESTARKNIVSGNQMNTVASRPHPIQQTVNNRMRQQRTAIASRPQKVSAQELKNQAIQKALASAEHLKIEEQTLKKERKSTKERMHFGVGRVVLALTCAAAAVFAIAYFVNLNMPDISLQVAAMQTGIDPSYPKYIPRGYSVSGITSEEGKITIEFKNNSSNSSFTLVEERSSWDSNALVSNFVKKEFGDDYTTIREQGLTIYIKGSDATWVNGGNVFKIQATDGELTSKQIRSIATSL